MLHERVTISSDEFIIHGFYECITNNSIFFKTQEGAKGFSSSSFKINKIQLLTYWFFIIFSVLWKRPCWTRWIWPERSCGPWKEAHSGACFLAGTVAHGIHLCWSSLCLKDCAPWKGPNAAAVLEELQHVGRTRIAVVHEGLCPAGGTPCSNRRDELLGNNCNSPFLIFPWELVGKWWQSICIYNKKASMRITKSHTTVFQLHHCSQAVNIGQASQVYFLLKGASRYWV